MTSAAHKTNTSLLKPPPMPAMHAIAATPAAGQRLIMVDALRGFGVVLMLAFHLLYDFRTFCSSIPLSLPAVFWRWAPVPIGSIFLFVVGWSLHLQNSKQTNHFWKVLRLRVAKVLAVAMFITAITAVFTPAMPVYFGILHCIAVSEIIAYPFRARPGLSLITASILLAAGFYLLNHKIFLTAYLLGVLPLYPMDMGDYYPLLPFLGFVLLGISFGHWVQASRTRVLHYTNNGVKALSYLGRHSLKIYLVNQPLFMAMLWALGFAKF